MMVVGPGLFSADTIIYFYEATRSEGGQRMRGERLHISSHSIDNYFSIQQLQYCIGGLVAFKDGEEAVYDLSAMRRIFGRQVLNLI